MENFIIDHTFWKTVVVTKYLQCIQYADLEEKKIGDLKKKEKK